MDRYWRAPSIDLSPISSWNFRPSAVGPDRMRLRIRCGGQSSHGAHSIKHTSYTSSAPVPVEAVVVGYRYQEQGAELVGDGGSLLGRGLAVASDEPVFTGAGEFRELRATDASRREFLIFYRYDIGGRQFADPLRSQLWYGLRSLGGAPLSTLIAFGTACNPGCEGDAPRLDAFVTEVEPRLRASLLVRRPRP